MELTLKRRKGKWHIMHPVAKCQHAVYLPILGREVDVFFGIDEPDDFEAFIVCGANAYIDQGDVCQTCKGNLVRHFR